MPGIEEHGPRIRNLQLLARNDPALPFPYVLPEVDDKPRRRGTLRIGWHQDLLTFDPTASTSAGALMVLNMVCNRLLGSRGNADLDPFTRQLEPELAASWERSPDGLTYTIHLDPRARWQDVTSLDRRPLVADDVRLAYERYAREGVHRSYFAHVEHMTAVDAHTFEVRLRRPQPDFELPLATRSLPVYPPELAEAGVLDGTTAFAGSGPMVLREAVRGSHILFERNRRYWRGDVHLDGVEVSIVPDAAQRLEGFTAGRFDYISSPVTSLTEARSLLAAAPDTQLHLVPAFSSQFGLALNLADPRFADERVRQALMLAIDREALREVLFEGLARILPSTPWPHLFDHEPSADDLGPWFHHDPGEARRLLEAAGASGLAFELLYHNYHDATNRRANELIAAQLLEGGVEMRLRPLDYLEYNARWSTNEYPEAIDGYAPSGFSADAYFHDSLVTGGGLNRWGISDPDLDRWAEQQSRALDPERRRELLRRIWDRVLERAYRIEKVGPLRFEVYQPWLRNMRCYDATGDIGLQIAGVWLEDATARA
jgi:peptide/nickel transport system substrate-binding protein